MGSDNKGSNVGCPLTSCATLDKLNNSLCLNFSSTLQVRISQATFVKCLAHYLAHGSCTINFYYHYQAVKVKVNWLVSSIKAGSPCELGNMTNVYK